MTAENLNLINMNFRDMIVSNIQDNLYKMSSEELDKIVTLKVSKEYKNCLDDNAVCIDHNYPDSDLLIRVYYCGGIIFKIITD